MTTTTTADQRTEAAAPATSSKLNRPCPVCGNSQRQRCKLWYAIPEFEVLRCRECEVTFINQAMNDNFGFTAESAVEADPAQMTKSINDFQQVKAKLNAAGVTGTPSLLDVGCGIGTFLQQAKREGWEVAGLELSPSVAAYARDQNRLQVDTCSIEGNTPFSSASFDVITLFGVIEHLTNPRGAAEECARLLRPGGVLILQTPAEDGMIRRAGRFLYWATGGRLSFQVRQLYQMHGGHSVCFNRHSMRTLLAAHGLEVFHFAQSTYGFSVLLYRFKGLPLLRKWVQILGTLVVFSLGRVLGGSNHMTVYARKRASGRLAA